MKLTNFIYAIFFLIACDNIGADFSLQPDSSIGFSRHFGTVGYDYGWNAEVSPFDEGIVIIGRQQRLINGQTE